MNGISHAVTALVITRRFPGVPILFTLLAVQLTDIVWVVLNLLGIEWYRVGAVVTSLADIDFVYNPYTHAVGSALILAAIVGAVAMLKSQRYALVLFLAVLSHVVLDIAIHKPDIGLSYWQQSIKMGTGLYGIPPWAFVVEIGYAALCWRYFGGSRRMLSWFVGLNLVAVSLYMPFIHGPETYIGELPILFAWIVATDIVVGMVAVYWLYLQER